MLEGYTYKKLNMVKVALETAKNHRFETIDEFLIEINTLMVKRERELKYNSPANTQVYHAPAGPPKCPSCGKGYVVDRRVEGIQYKVCKYKDATNSQQTPQGCGWSRMVKQ